MLTGSKVFCRGKVLCATEQYVLYYRKGCLFVAHTDTSDTVMQSYPLGTRFSGLSVLERLTRSEPRCAVMLSKDVALISFSGAVLRYDIRSNKLITEHLYDKGMRNPLQFCVRPMADGDKNVYYGEYIWNQEKGPVAVFKREKNVWGKVYEFPANSITHIHGIVYDPYRNCFYILTGDADSESGIWVADEAFATVKPLLIGKQAYRSCVAFPTENGLLYATDTPLGKNGIYAATVQGDNCTTIEEKYVLPGSCIFGTYLGNKFYFSTTVEPDSTLPNWRYRLTNKLGAGILDRYSHVIQVEPDGSAKEIFKRKKDALPMWLFQFGNIQFPYNETDKLLINLQSLKNRHGLTLQLDWK